MLGFWMLRVLKLFKMLFKNEWLKDVSGDHMIHVLPEDGAQGLEASEDKVITSAQPFL